jgi:protein TonB
MAHRSFILLLALLATTFNGALAQDSDTSQHVRKVVHMVTPAYPDLARRLQISGTVKLWAKVAPNGSVKTIEPVGGNPVLIKSAQDAVGDWKYAPASAETRELIELHFTAR